MIKIKKFECTLFCPNPQKAMEKFINQNGIRQESIISMESGSNVVARGRLAPPVFTLTYKE